MQFGKACTAWGNTEDNPIVIAAASGRCVIEVALVPHEASEGVGTIGSAVLVEVVDDGELGVGDRRLETKDNPIIHGTDVISRMVATAVGGRSTEGAVRQLNEVAVGQGAIGTIEAMEHVEVRPIWVYPVDHSVCIGTAIGGCAVESAVLPLDKAAIGA